uniref:Uncharacterized protein n=1 Tax=Rhizophora mucronata TaxID=61149 RepID=A0A2P2MZG5_RHIMU
MVVTHKSKLGLDGILLQITSNHRYEVSSDCSPSKPYNSFLSSIMSSAWSHFYLLLIINVSQL